MKLEEKDRHIDKIEKKAQDTVRGGEKRSSLALNFLQNKLK